MNQENIIVIIGSISMCIPCFKVVKMPFLGDVCVPHHSICGVDYGVNYFALVIVVVIAVVGKIIDGLKFIFSNFFRY